MTHAVALALVLAAALTAQSASRLDALIAAVKPLLPYPAASADGELPSDNSATSKWFVVWPRAADDVRIIVKANPLNPEVQKESEEAMAEINAAVAAAERRAQAAYDKALEQLRKTGKGGDLEAVTLDDEGIAGERIDAEQTVTIELANAESFEITSSESPAVSAAMAAGVWLVSIPANTYRSPAGAQGRDHFRAEEARLYFGLPSRPDVHRPDAAHRFRVTVPPATNAFAVVVRGNTGLVRQMATQADWSLLVPR
jgi:hypothetical protein